MSGETPNVSIIPPVDSAPAESAPPPPAPTAPATPTALSTVADEVKVAQGVAPVKGQPVPWKAPYPVTPKKAKPEDPDPEPVMVLAKFMQDVTLNGVSYLRGNEYIISAEVAHGLAAAITAPDSAEEE